MVIGGGPAGLMACDALLAQGLPTVLIEAKPSVGRKFLMAGKSGLNLTKMEAKERFTQQYGVAARDLAPMLAGFGPGAVQAWAEGLGQPCFTGSSGRLFPHAMKASPLLRAWLARLDGGGLSRHTKWRWTGWQGADLSFDTVEGVRCLSPAVTVLALGGASWARLGSDGAWAATLAAAGVPLSPFAPSNAGLCVTWSAHMSPHLGAPLKNLSLRAGALHSRGEVVLSARGLEGGGLYPLTPALREGAPLYADLLPDIPLDRLAARLSRSKGKASLSTLLRKATPLTPAARALVMEMGRPLPADPATLAALLKALPLPHAGVRPMDEAISTAGGVPFDAMDKHLMLKAKPGVFCAGEMLDWEAPTGGYLLNACLATGLWAGQHAARWVNAPSQQYGDQTVCNEDGVEDTRPTQAAGPGPATAE